MNSEQEKYVSNLIAHSMGAPFIFEPKIGKKGGTGNFEPADLVWVNDDSTIILNMYGGKGDADHHNFRQLKGCLRYWKELKQNIVGKNQYQEFNIPYHEMKNILLISVGNNSNVNAKYNIEQFNNIKIRYPEVCGCISFSDSTLQLLGTIGASAIDLVAIANFLKNCDGEISASELNQYIEHFHWQANSFTPKRIRFYINYFKSIILGLRKENKELAKIFNDLSMAQMAALSKDIGHMCFKIDDVPFGKQGIRAGSIIHEAPPYAFCITAYALRKDMKDVIDYFDKIRLKAMEIQKRKALIPVYLNIMVAPEHLGAFTAFDESGKISNFSSMMKSLKLP